MKQSLILFLLSVTLVLLMSQCNYNKNGCDGNCSSGYGNKWQSDGSYQNGHWKNGKMIGYGKQYFGYNSKFAGDYYVGEFDNNLYNGYGAYYGKRINFIHVGYWKDSKPNGYGVVRFGEHSIAPNGYYKGWWKDGLHNGYGVIYTGTKGLNPNIRYCGNWLNGFVEGIGVYYWSDGSRYEGHFSNDLFDGTARFIFSDGLTIVSTWQGGHNPNIMRILGKHNIETKGKDSVLINYFSRDSTNVSYLRNATTM
jgi:hypothetical protein